MSWGGDGSTPIGPVLSSMRWRTYCPALFFVRLTFAFFRMRAHALTAGAPNQEAWKKSWWPEIAAPEWTWEGLRFCVPPYHLPEDRPSTVDNKSVCMDTSALELRTPSIMYTCSWMRAHIHLLHEFSMHDCLLPKHKHRVMPTNICVYVCMYARMYVCRTGSLGEKVELLNMHFGQKRGLRVRSSGFGRLI